MALTSCISITKPQAANTALLTIARGIQIGTAFIVIGLIWQRLGLPSNPPAQAWIALSAFAVFVFQAACLQVALEYGLAIRAAVWLARKKGGEDAHNIGGSSILPLVFFLAPYVAFLTAAAVFRST